MYVMTFLNVLKGIMNRGKKASEQAEYRAVLAKKLNNRNFIDLSEKEKEEVLEIAAKDFSSKFRDDIAVLANE